MIALQQTVLEQAAVEARAGHYVEAWAIAASDARARTYVRHHAGDLDGALREARAGLRLAPADPWLLSSATEIALALHRGAGAERTLAEWKAVGRAEDVPRVEQAARELEDLRRIERNAASSVGRGRWISALAGALGLALVLVFARRVN